MVVKIRIYFNWKRKFSYIYIMDFFLGGLFYILIILIIRGVLGLLGLILGKKVRLNREKLRSFECGFDPIDSSRNSFSLRFFLLAIVFLIFDVEIVLLFPYIIRLVGGVYFIVKLCVIVFVLVLLIGLVHEFNEGSLD